MKKIITFLVLIFSLTIGTIFAQNRSISGVVISSEDNEPIIGATVIVTGTQIGTVTDIDGKFTLGKVPSTAKNIKASLIGYKTKEVSISGSIVNISLEPDATALDEVFVVAYGTATRQSFTGSASVLKSDAIGKIQTSSVTNSLEGQAAGVQLISSTGQPGENPKVRIRGIGSINAGKDPLYICII